MTEMKPSWKIVHNPKCSKSRSALEILQSKGIQPAVIEYLKTPLSKADLELWIKLLDCEVRDLVRVKESEFNPEKIDLGSKESVLSAIQESPILMERPLVSNGVRAVIARPPERVLELL